MSTKIFNKCPACGNDLSISALKCNSCGIEIKGEFEIPEIKDSLFTEEEMNFLKLFLKFEGNISKVQKDLNISYFDVKAKLKLLNVKLGNEIENEMPKLTELVEPTGKGLVSQALIEKLKKCGGSAECSMLKGDPIRIWLTEDGVANSAYTLLTCTWQIFEAIVAKAKELGGIMFRGDVASQNGARIGSEELPLDTIDSFISLKFYGSNIGDTTLRRSTYYAAILAWAGICNNMRSKGQGGYIMLLPEWK